MTRPAILISAIGLACFIIGALVLAAHPDHRWQEITGEPEMVPIQVRDDGGVVTTRIE